MKQIPLFALVSLLALSPSVQANPQPKATPSATPRPTPQNPADNAQVQKILSELGPYFPNLSAADVARTSENDLRQLYYKSYCAQNMKMMEARQKANSLPSDMFQINLMPR